jgi:hypothetical protein
MPFKPGCYFCGQTPLSEYRVTASRPNDPPRVQVEVWLCRSHYAALAVAEGRGRVHEPSGIRWELGWQEELVPDST